MRTLNQLVVLCHIMDMEPSKIVYSKADGSKKDYKMK